MLRHLTISNLKSIESFSTDVRDLNILIGPNNSGKTTILHALALLKQSIDKLTFNGPLVNLGDFSEAVYRHESEREMRIAFNLAKRGYIRQRISCHISIKGDERGQPYISSSAVADGREEIGYYRRDRKSEIAGVAFSLVGFLPYPSSGPIGEIEERTPIVNSIREEFSGYLFYLSARRGTSLRYEAVDSRYSRLPDDVGLYGERTIPILAHIRDEPRYTEVLKKVDSWLERFGLTEAIAKFEQGPAFSLRARNRRTEIQSNILDIGFGLNQLLPVLLQCFYAPKGSLVMVEQPEAHLHPKSQADVADFLVDVVNYGNRVIVETHSEHLLLRLQRRVAENRLKPQRINVCYLEESPKGTQKTDMKMDDQGFFTKPVPPGFFEEGFREAIAHLRASKPEMSKNDPA